MKKRIPGNFSSSDLEDLNALQNIKAGNHNAFERIVKKYHDPLFRKLVMAVRSESVAEDMLQEIFMKVYLKINYYEKQYTFNAWITRVADNHIIDYVRKNQRNPLARAMSLDEPVLTPTGSHVRLELEDQSSAVDNSNYETQHTKHYQAIQDLMNQLPQKDQVILELFFFHKKPQKEISSLLKMTHENVRVRIHRLKAKINKLAADTGLEIQLENF